MTTKISSDVIQSSAITNDKITSLATSKLTGTISNAQLASGISASKLTGALPAIDGSALTGITNSYAGNKVSAYLTPGTYTWSVPNGVTSALVACYGAGGGGSPSYNAGRGGSGLVHVTNLTPGGSVTVTVGLGGQSGSAGGASSFGNWITANGGSAHGNNYANGNSTSGNGAIPYQIGLNTLQKTTFPWVDENRVDRPTGSGNTTRVNFSWTHGWLPGAGGQASGTNYWQGAGGVGGLVLIYY